MKAKKIHKKNCLKLERKKELEKRNTKYREILNAWLLDVVNPMDLKTH